MPSYKKIRIEPNTGVLETNDFEIPIVSPGTSETPILPPQPRDLKTFKKPVLLEGAEFVSYIVVSSTGILQSERQLIVGSGLVLTDNGPNSTVELKLDDSFKQQTLRFYADNSLLVSAAEGINLKSGSNVIISASFNSALSTVDYTINVNVPSFGISLVDLGVGSHILQLSGNSEIKQKSIVGSGIVDINSSPNSIVISAQAVKFVNISGKNGIIATGGPITNSGEIVLELNLQLSSTGTTGEVLLSLSGNEINQKKILGGGGIEVSSTGTTLIISSKPVVTVNLDVSSLGTGSRIISEVSGLEIKHRTLVQGSGITITETSSNITISFNTSSIPSLKITELGTSGALLISADPVDNHGILLKRIVGGGSIEVSATNNYVIVSSSPILSNNWIHANNGNNFSVFPAASASNAVAIGNAAKASLSGAVAFGNGVTSSALNAIAIGKDIKVSSNNSIVFGINRSSMIINVSGNVGIGTLNPQATLHVENNEENSIIQITNTVATSGVLLGLLSGTNHFTINNIDGGNIVFQVDKKDKFILEEKRFVYKNGNFAINNDALVFTSLLKTTVSANVSGQRIYFTFEDGSELFVPDNSAWMYDVRVVAKQKTQKQAAAYKLEGLILKGTGNSTLEMIGSPLETLISETTSAFAWQAVVSAAANTNGNMRIFVIVSSTQQTQDIDWLAFVTIYQIVN